MGVVLLSCITQNEITKARVLFCCSLLKMKSIVGARARSGADDAWVVCSNTTAEPHEYFDHTGYQVNFRLPADIAKGSATIHVSAAWISSVPVSISVQE
jgi:hypothetical protein